MKCSGCQYLTHPARCLYELPEGEPVGACAWRAANPPPAPSRPPGLAGKVASATVAAVKFVAGGFRLAPPEARAERTAICGACPEQDKAAAQCTVCGCKLKAKIAMASEACPAGKWPALTVLPDMAPPPLPPTPAGAAGTPAAPASA